MDFIKNVKYAPYSYSKLNTFDQCQKKFEYIYVNKISIDAGYIDPSYFKRGRFLHAYIANRLNGGDGTNMKRYDVEINDKMHLIDCANHALDNDYIKFSYDFDINMIESYIALNNKLNPIKVKEPSILNGYIDYFAVKDNYAVIVDWKSGKFRSDTNYFQLKLYALWLIQKYPKITEIDLVFYYVEHDKIKLKIVTPQKIFSFKNNLIEKINFIENTTEFHTNESKLCKKCPFIITCMEHNGIGEL